MTTEDLDLIRAAGEGMIDRREDDGHPVNTDPPTPTGPQGPESLGQIMAAEIDRINSQGGRRDEDETARLLYNKAYRTHDWDTIRPGHGATVDDNRDPWRRAARLVDGWIDEMFPSERACEVAAAVLRAGVASQDDADSGVEEDTRHVSGGRNFNALTASEEHYMILARSWSDKAMRQHLADFGITHPSPVSLRSLAGLCYILARRLETGRKS